MQPNEKPLRECTAIECIRELLSREFLAGEGFFVDLHTGDVFTFVDTRANESDLEDGMKRQKKHHIAHITENRTVANIRKARRGRGRGNQS